MWYMGSKARLAARYAQVIKSLRLPGQVYVEPFVGGANLICAVDGPRIGADKCPYLIALLTAVRDGWTPPEFVSEEYYNAVKADRSGYPAHNASGKQYPIIFSYGYRRFDGYSPSP